MLNRRIYYLIAMLMVFAIAVSTGAVGLAQPDLDKINSYKMNPEKDIAQQDISSGTLIFKVFLSLIFIVGLILATYWFLRVLKLDRSIGAGRSRYMKAIDFMPLGNNRGIYILKIVNDYYAVSVFEKGVQILFKLTDNISDMEASDTDLSKQGFRDVLSQVFKAKQSDSKDSYIKDNNFNRFWQKLNNLSGFKKSGGGKNEGSDDEGEW